MKLGARLINLRFSVWGMWYSARWRTFHKPHDAPKKRNEHMFVISAEKAVQELRAGNPVVFPTDTVCGLGVSVLHAKSPQSLFEIKKRPTNKPIAWLVQGIGELRQYGKNVPDYAFALAREFWPGALTLVVHASAAVPVSYLADNFCSNDLDNSSSKNSCACDSFSNNPYPRAYSSIGLRCPKSKLVHYLLGGLKSPLCTTSANFSGQPAPTSLIDLDENFAQDLFVVENDTTSTASACTASIANTCDATSAKARVASTVIDCTSVNPKILRAGSITESQISKVVSACL